MLGRKQCPQCAEKIRKEAKVCRYCGFRFPDPEPAEIDKGTVEDTRRVSRWVLIAIAVAVLSGAVLLGLSLSKDIQPTIGASSTSTTMLEPEPVEPQIEEPLADPIPTGTTYEWIAATAMGSVQRQIGPMLITITSRKEDDLVAPVLEIRAGAQVVRLEGELVSSNYGHKISAVQNNRGGSPIVMLQSFSGGAHCCNHVQLAGIAAGKLTTIDLGSWDGDEIPLPTDISNDGVADFVVGDDRFLYAFAPYAMSYAPPKVLNVIGGKVRDVSTRPAFRSLFADTVNKTRPTCLADEDGFSRNGACAAYVAAAARIGRLDDAWTGMVRAYVAVDWQLPTACMIETDDICPSESEIHFKSYPESLLYFLRKAGYISSGWSPPGEPISDPLENPEPDTVGI